MYSLQKSSQLLISAVPSTALCFEAGTLINPSLSKAWPSQTNLLTPPLWLEVVSALWPTLWHTAHGQRHISRRDAAGRCFVQAETALETIYEDYDRFSEASASEIMWRWWNIFWRGFLWFSYDQWCTLWCCVVLRQPFCRRSEGFEGSVTVRDLGWEDPKRDRRSQDS